MSAGPRGPALMLGALVGLSTSGLVMQSALPAQAQTVTTLDTGQYNYMLSCGGCHGLTGLAPRSGVPDLQGKAGLFLCSTQGREYAIRLPNVAFADMDDAALAETMNYVMFVLGGDSAPVGAQPYSPAEVRGLRLRPLKNSAVVAMAHDLRMQAAALCDPSA